MILEDINIVLIEEATPEKSQVMKTNSDGQRVKTYKWSCPDGYKVSGGKYGKTKPKCVKIKATEQKKLDKAAKKRSKTMSRDKTGMKQAARKRSKTMRKRESQIKDD